MLNFLRRLLHGHVWVRQPDELQSYGMGLEWFNVWHCRCSATRDCLRGEPRTMRVWPAISAGKRNA